MKSSQKHQEKQQIMEKQGKTKQEEEKYRKATKRKGTDAEGRSTLTTFLTWTSCLQTGNSPAFHIFSAVFSVGRHQDDSLRITWKEKL